MPQTSLMLKNFYLIFLLIFVIINQLKNKNILKFNFINKNENQMEIKSFPDEQYKIWIASAYKLFLRTLSGHLVLYLFLWVIIGTLSYKFGITLHTNKELILYLSLLFIPAILELNRIFMLEKISNSDLFLIKNLINSIKNIDLAKTKKLIKFRMPKIFFLIFLFLILDFVGHFLFSALGHTNNHIYDISKLQNINKNTFFNFLNFNYGLLLIVILYRNNGMFDFGAHLLYFDKIAETEEAEYINNYCFQKNENNFHKLSRMFFIIFMFCFLLAPIISVFLAEYFYCLNYVIYKDVFEDGFKLKKLEKINVGLKLKPEKIISKI